MQQRSVVRMHGTTCGHIGQTPMEKQDYQVKSLVVSTSDFADGEVVSTEHKKAIMVEATTQTMRADRRRRYSSLEEKATEKQKRRDSHARAVEKKLQERCSLPRQGGGTYVVKPNSDEFRTAVEVAALVACTTCGMTFPSRSALFRRHLVDSICPSVAGACSSEGVNPVRNLRAVGASLAEGQQGRSAGTSSNSTGSPGLAASTTPTASFGVSADAEVKQFDHDYSPGSRVRVYNMTWCGDEAIVDEVSATHVKVRMVVWPCNEIREYTWPVGDLRPWTGNSTWPAALARRRIQRP